jgi:hypothetical protein
VNTLLKRYSDLIEKITERLYAQGRKWTWTGTIHRLPTLNIIPVIETIASMYMQNKEEAVVLMTDEYFTTYDQELAPPEAAEDTFENDPPEEGEETPTTSFVVPTKTTPTSEAGRLFREGYLEDLKRVRRLKAATRYGSGPFKQ